MEVGRLQTKSQLSICDDIQPFQCPEVPKSHEGISRKVSITGLGPRAERHVWITTAHRRCTQNKPPYLSEHKGLRTYIIGHGTENLVLKL